MVTTLTEVPSHALDDIDENVIACMCSETLGSSVLLLLMLELGNRHARRYKSCELFATWSSILDKNSGYQDSTARWKAP